jgi:hypothetical protein
MVVLCRQGLDLISALKLILSSFSISNNYTARWGKFLRPHCNWNSHEMTRPGDNSVLNWFTRQVSVHKGLSKWICIALFSRVACTPTHFIQDRKCLMRLPRSQGPVYHLSQVHQVLRYIKGFFLALIALLGGGKNIWLHSFKNRVKKEDKDVEMFRPVPPPPPTHPPTSRKNKINKHTLLQRPSPLLNPPPPSAT